MRSQKWMLDIKKCIGVDENILESYDGWLNDEYVYMVFTKTRVSLNLPYSRIKTVTLEKPDIIFSTGLAFTDYIGFKRVFISEYESAQEIERKLRELIQRSVPSMSARAREVTSGDNKKA